MTLADGSYHYYHHLPAFKDTRPTLCEVLSNHVSECGEEGWVPLSMYPGEFRKLVEQPQPEGSREDAQGVDNEEPKK